VTAAELEAIVAKVCADDLTKLNWNELKAVVKRLQHGLTGIRLPNKDSFVAIIEELNRAYPLLQTIFWMIHHSVDKVDSHQDSELLSGLLNCCISLTFGKEVAFSKKAIDEPEIVKIMLKLTNIPETRNYALALIQNLMADNCGWSERFVKEGLLYWIAQILTKVEYPQIMQHHVSIYYILHFIRPSKALAQPVLEV
jgi:hypothetical protein